MKNVFIIGSKGIPANYGGFETFVEYLTCGFVRKVVEYVAIIWRVENFAGLSTMII